MKTKTFYGEVIGDRARDEITLRMMYKEVIDELIDRLRRCPTCPRLSIHPHTCT